MLTVNGNPTKVNNNYIDYSYSIPKGVPPVILSSHNITGNFYDLIGPYGYVKYDNLTINGVNLSNQYFYKLDAATAIAESIEGWHLPTIEEWSSLFDYYGNSVGISLKSTTGWTSGYNGGDINNLEIYPLGYNYMWFNKRLYNSGYEARYWTTSVFASNSYYSPRIYYRDEGTTTANSTYNDGNYYLPLRLAKDL